MDTTSYTKIKEGHKRKPGQVLTTFSTKKGTSVDYRNLFEVELGEEQKTFGEYTLELEFRIKDLESEKEKLRKDLEETKEVVSDIINIIKKDKERGKI